MKTDPIGRAIQMADARQRRQHRNDTACGCLVLLAALLFALFVIALFGSYFGSLGALR